MDKIVLEDLLLEISKYNEDIIAEVKRAYYYAARLHDGQFRQSGDAYITHPLHVALILAQMHADSDTICAGLLHDTLEDTNITKEDIAHDFNPTVASLVLGVTKLAKMNFSCKEEENSANTRKIITSITEDVRIIIIKLADRLHNMRTLQYKDAFKQKENAIETMEVFVPLAYYIGAYRMKSELEDLSLKYLKPDIYKKIEEKKQNIEQSYQDVLLNIKDNVHNVLMNAQINNEIKIRPKNIYGIYKRLNEGQKLYDIHDLFALKIMVDDIYKCYLSLGLIHKEYHPINEKFKDYICNPKTNMYQSLHTTVFAPNDRLVQMQIRTFVMDKIASFGLTAYFDLSSSNARDIMQNDLKTKYQFFRSLMEINSMFGDNQQFVSQVKKELFSESVYVYTTKGEVIELPKGSTIIDFAYRVSQDEGNAMVAALVNEEFVPLNYVLKNKDRVRIVTDELAFGPKEEWLQIAKTSYAKSRIKQFYNK